MSAVPLMVKAVLTLGADPLIKNQDGDTPIDLAINRKCSKVIMD
eukprot:CAMPEP_0170551846 /NCGR_PEP_ID=MMETSP0211-20121228/9850_1 /TAXON_ID=311385 /ORGANISM="Pseudokeronopsis sp., Strain OXSARD2" /LENGTH=43 /DNA_ID= /DNA_START= /DNA_END= /DNA_ORIENTATION=